MRKYIEHLISLLLIFGLTAGECSIYSQTNATNYYQLSYVSTRNELNYDRSGLYVYSGKTTSKKSLNITLFAFRNLQSVYSLQIKNILKFQLGLYQRIDSIIAQLVFLNRVITSIKNYSSLYIA